jgi:hypothetical protein
MQQGEKAMPIPVVATRRWALAWLGLYLAFAVHVVDEAANDFLSVYNPIVVAIREQWPLLVLPTFTFQSWAALLGIALVGLLSLTPFVLQGKRWMLPLSIGFALVMIGNGFVHTVGSIYVGRMLPGLYSSPLLVGAALLLLLIARRAARQMR